MRLVPVRPGRTLRKFPWDDFTTIHDVTMEITGTQLGLHELDGIIISGIPSLVFSCSN